MNTDWGMIGALATIAGVLIAIVALFFSKSLNKKTIKNISTRGKDSSININQK